MTLTKKLAAAALAFLMVLTMVPAATAVTTRVQTQTTMRIASRSGPGTQYDETGSYFSKGTTVTALSKAYDSRNGIWWVQIELEYSSQKRRVYTGQKRLNVNMDSLPEDELLGTGTMSRSATGYYGPGNTYAAKKYSVSKGTAVEVYDVENGWLQIEFTWTNGSPRRCWVPQDAVSGSYNKPHSSGQTQQDDTATGLYYRTGYGTDTLLLQSVDETIAIVNFTWNSFATPGLVCNAQGDGGYSFAYYDNAGYMGGTLYFAGEQILVNISYSTIPNVNTGTYVYKK